MKSVPRRTSGGQGGKNGEPLRVAAGHFDAFVTVDRNIEKQQNVSVLCARFPLFRARSNYIDDLLPLMPRVRELLPGFRTGQLLHVEVGYPGVQPSQFARG